MKNKLIQIILAIFILIVFFGSVVLPIFLFNNLELVEPFYLRVSLLFIGILLVFYVSLEFFSLRKTNVTVGIYGALEVNVGLYTLLSIFFVQDKSFIVFSVLAAIYIMVRGFDNIDKNYVSVTNENKDHKITRSLIYKLLNSNEKFLLTRLFKKFILYSNDKSTEEKKNSTTTIMNHDQYLSGFQDVPNDGQSGETFAKQSEALKNALDIRKFEIDLYWKRATYFFAFIAAIFAGYFLLISRVTAKDKDILLVSILGFIFSYFWYLVNRGSKFWQKNWESHVDHLEDDIMGPLYKTVLNPSTKKFLNLLEEYPFSVSKINQLLSMVVSFVWLYIIFDVLFRIFEGHAIEIIVIELLSVVILNVIVIKLGRSKLPKNVSKEALFIRRELNDSKNKKGENPEDISDYNI